MDNLFSKLADELSQEERYKDPVVWAKEKAGITLWSKQEEIVRSIKANKQTAVRSAHGTGKSLLASILACWWIDTHPLGEAYVVSTAPSRTQVHSILWETMRRIHNKANLPGEIQISDRWVINGQEVGIGRRPADHQPYSFQGIHRKYVLFILDEACGIPKWLWDAGISITTSEHCRILAIGNPDDPNSEFKFKFDSGSAWHNIKISIWDSPNFTGEEVTASARENLSDKSYVEVAEQDWGIGTAIWQSKIEGNFPEEDESAVIPVSWVQEAFNRFELYDDVPKVDVPESEYAKILSVDVAYTGRDKTVIAHYREPQFLKFEEFNPRTQKELFKIISERANKRTDKIVIDVGGGYGSGVYELLRDAGYNVVAFSGGNKTTKLDKTRKFSFTRIRSAAFWNVRELLNPISENDIAFPPADTPGAFKNKEAGQKLQADLTTPKYEIQLDRIQVESKDSIRKRLRRSTDYGDTVMMALWIPPISNLMFDEATFSWITKGDDDTVFSYEKEGGERDDGFSYGRY